jgi:hypothetical protein
MRKSCRLGFRGRGVSYQFNMRRYVCRNVPLVHFCTSILLIPGSHEDSHHHVTPISGNRIVLTPPPRGTKFPNHHFLIISFSLHSSLLGRFFIVAMMNLPPPPPHHSNRHHQSLLPWWCRSLFVFEPLLVSNASIVMMNTRKKVH